MKNLALIICTVILLSGCSIQGRYYLYDTTDHDVDIPWMIDLSTDNHGILSNTGSRILASSFIYEVDRLFEKYKVINIEYIDTTKFHLSSKGLVDGDIITLSGADDPSKRYHFVKVDVPEMKVRKQSAKKMKRYEKILRKKYLGESLHSR